MPRPSVSLAVALVLATAVSPASAVETPRSYKPIPAETGARITPAPDLLATAKRLRDAAAAKDAEAVFALVADQVTFASSGITLGVARRMEKKGPYASADEALAAIGLAWTEGEPIAPAGKPFDPTASRIATAMSTIVELVDGAEWGRDPLVVGGFCTAPGAKWDAKAATAARIGGERGTFVTAETKARAEPGETAPVVATLKPGALYLAGGDEENGWPAVRLPNGKVGWVPPAATRSATPWGLCFLPDGQGGWLMSAVVSALN